MTRCGNPKYPYVPLAHRRAVALVTVLLLLTLLIAVVAEMVSLSGTEAILATRQVNDLRHQLALQSAVDLVARILQTDTAIRTRLDRGETVPLGFDLPGGPVQLRLRNDGGKFDAAAFGNAKQAAMLADKLRALGRHKGLPAAALTLRPVQEALPGSRPYLWFDQLFDLADPLAVFAWPGDPRTADRWSDWITVFGPGKVDLLATDEVVLSAMLDDLQDGLGRQVLANRSLTAANADDAVETALQGIEDQAVRDAARARLGWDLGRYSVLATIGMGTDVRVFYVVMSIPRAIVYDERTRPGVLLRRQIRW